MRKYLALLFLFTSIVHAEEPDRGRLPDGRAFRTDSDGTQLVDYIAELELQVESLTRQVQGLEDESKQRLELVERLQSGKEANPELVEKNIGGAQPGLIKDSSTKCEPKIIEKIIEKPANCLPVSCPKVEQADCGATLSQAKLEQDKKYQELLNAKEQEIVSLRNELSTANSKKAALLPVASEAPARGAGSETRSKAVETLRKSMLKDLRSLEDLVAYRDKLFAKVDKSKFNAMPTVPIKETRLQLETAENVNELSKVRGRMNEQRGKVQQEIASFKRELKIR